jgi:tape measure domain-containing protein
VAKYTADIEIAVRGGAQVDGLIKNLNRLNNSINVVNRNAKLLEGKGFNVASMENYSRAVFKAENALRKAAQGTRQEEMAVKSLVSAMEIENKARARRNFLIAQEVANRRQVIATANAGYGLQGPQAANIRAGRGPASPIRGTANMPGSPAALAAAAGGGGIARAAGGGMSGRLGGALSSALIGGGFPLLFGQGAGAAAGGALGGVAGGLLGGGFGFGLSIVGTLLGDIASRGQVIKQLGQDIGFSSQQTQALSAAFKTANTDVEKFTAVIQNIRGLGLEIEDQAKAIQLVTTLTEKYGGSFEKTGNAITTALESGKVTQQVLNQLTSQGINIQGELANKYGKNRDAILKMAKDGEISVQDLIDTLVKMGNEGVDAVNKPKTSMQNLKDSVDNLAKSLAGLASNLVKTFGPALQWLTDRVADFVNAVARAISRMADLMNGGRMAQAEIRASSAAETATREKFGPLGGIRAFNPAAQKFYEQQKQAELKKLVPGAFTPTQTKTPLETFTAPSQAAAASGGGTDKAAKAAEREKARVAELVRSQALITLEYKRQQELGQKIFAAEMAKDPMLARRLEGERQLVEWGIETADLLEKESSAAGQLAIAKAQQAKQGLIIQKTAQDLTRLEQERKENAQNTILGLQQELALRNATTEAERTSLRIQYEMDALKRGKQYTDPELQQIETLKKQLAAPETAGEIIQKRIGALQDELIKLTNIGNIAVSVADSIGTAFSQAFQGIISGTMTTQEALASFFKSVGDAFIQMASEIIAKQLTMIILQTILKALGGGSFGGGGGGATNSVANFNLGAAQYGGGLAGGGPTRAGTPYLVGERGPELFVPGTSGGVMSNSDLRASMGAAPGSSGGPVLNMTFETSTINGVEYVSRDQLEAAMAVTRRQAARDGANRGMTMTLDRLQQSPSTRRKVGI